MTRKQNEISEQSIASSIRRLGYKSDVCRRKGSVPKEIVLISTTAGLQTITLEVNDTAKKTFLVYSLLNSPKNGMNPEIKTSLTKSSSTY